MTNNSPRNPRSELSDSRHSLTDRVAERVVNARLAIEAQPKTSGSSPRRTSPRSDAFPLDLNTGPERRELQSLKRVFRDMGRSYRRYRSQVGGPVVPGLRDAAYTFRANPSLPALVAVAAYLDELDLLS